MSGSLVFISYSHEDEVEKDRLLTHLGVLRPDLIDLWSDDDLGAGDHWEREITQAIGRAKVAVLLVTANFLNSDFILREEVPRLLKRRKHEGLVVFPVIAKACAWRTVPWLKEMQVRPKYGNPVWGQQAVHVEEDLAKIAEEVAMIVRTTKTAGTRALDPSKSSKAPGESSAALHRENSENLRVTRVLIVENDRKFRESLIDVFGDTDITFVEADSVESAKRILDGDQEIQIILLDLGLPGENGTSLLKCLKERGSDYRVIILTGHDELLPAHEAATFKVFHYLSKSEKGLTGQSVRFAVQQARQDIEREKLAKRNKSDEFDDVILNKYPTPFSYIYQELKSDLVDPEILARQKDIFELLLNFSAVVLVCEYLNSSTRNSELDILLSESILSPTLGDWLNITNDIVERKNDSEASFFLDKFSAFLTDSSKSNITDLIVMREKYLAHRTTLSAFEYQEVILRCNKLLVPLLQDYRFITSFLMCYVSSVQKVKTGYKYRLKECTGANPQLLFSIRELKLLMNANEVQLVNLDDDQFLSLHPFIILENCTDCKQLEIFFFFKLAEDKLHYRSYRTGHAITSSSQIKDFKEMFETR